MMHSFTGELETEFNYGDVDSGNSTNHSPNEDKNISQATEGKTFFIALEPFLGSVLWLCWLAANHCVWKLVTKSQLQLCERSELRLLNLKLQFGPFQQSQKLKEIDFSQENCNETFLKDYQTQCQLDLPERHLFTVSFMHLLLQTLRGGGVLYTLKSNGSSLHLANFNFANILNMVKSF